MPTGGKYPSLAELARTNPDAYRAMSVPQRLDMVQAPMGAGQELSPDDQGLLQILRARREREMASQSAPQIAPEENQGFLSRLFQFMSGRQPVDPLEALKQPGYAGPASR
jgi:hypothetical protein